MTGDELVSRLAEVAADAVRARQAAISGGAGHLRSIHVEIEVANGGDVLDVTSYLEWKKTIRRAT